MIENTDCFNIIHVGEDVKKVLFEYRELTQINKREYGGILLGKISEGGQVYVDIATEPSAFDISGNMSFVRNKKPAQDIIDHFWRESEGVVNYLGEWHTHPFESNNPSSGDIEMLNEALFYNENCFDFTLMIIIDITNNYSITISNQYGIMTKGNIFND